ncbi:MAG: hypothetical protein A2Z60_02080 [Nitrospirae bacterium RIFCSPLOWO2_02_42_7]|nr:MAG: hypothetical protein A2Z60_02080 [Nitrospirae bacterium RIFCSPLOWO2_02_42_7]
MKVDFPIDERSEKFLKDLESDEDISAIISLLLSRKGEDFSNYASIICFCFREKDLIDLANVKTLPEKVKSWAKKKMLEGDPTFMEFFKRLFSLYSSFSQTEEGLSILGKRRSIFPEIYVFHRLRDVYGYSPKNVVRRDCYVVVGDWDTRRDRTREEGQKIDIGAWDPDKESGQCYECKVKFYIKEKEHQLHFLEAIRDHSEGKIHVFLASFAPKKVVLRQLNSFFPGRDFSKINIFGIDELKNL